jgi:choline dehydrogenase-like flavoprotein
MLSGIGPAAHLAEHGIPVVLSLPAVGSTLQEHLGLNLRPFAINRTFGLVDPLTPENVNLYVHNASGPLANMMWWGKYATHVAHGYFPSRTYDNPAWPDLHCYINQLIVSPEGQPTEQQIIPELELVRTDQVGTVRLASADPQDDPIIDPHFLEDPVDIQRLVEGIEFLSDLFLNSTTFRAMGIRWSENYEVIPTCEEWPFPSTEYWTCYIQAYVHSDLHPTSTCRMGPNSSVAVVDSRLRVFGATGLRVVDSSVMPFVPNGNTNLPSIMVGEMGSRIILNQI